MMRFLVSHIIYLSLQARHTNCMSIVSSAPEVALRIPKREFILDLEQLFGRSSLELETLDEPRPMFLRSCLVPISGDTRHLCIFHIGEMQIPFLTGADRGRRRRKPLVTPFQVEVVVELTN